MPCGGSLEPAAHIDVSLKRPHKYIVEGAPQDRDIDGGAGAGGDAGPEIATRAEKRTGHRIELAIVTEEQTLEALMARDQLRAALGENFYALEENLARGDAGPLCRDDGGSRAIRDDKLEGQAFDHLD